MNQIIIHVDMDAFFAAVEIRDNPALSGRPLIIGSLPHERGVVATANYEARKFGVHSAMNIKDAYRLCPQGVYMHPDMDKYKAVSMQLHSIWHEYASALQAIAFDEAYLDVRERAKDFDGARRIGLEIKRRIREELKLTCSVGVAYSKTAAKTASEEKKPDGYFEIRSPEEFVRLMRERSVRALYTVGEKTAQKLQQNGIYTVRDIQENQETVIRLLGKQGQWITQLAFGIDDRPVTPYRPEDAKSIGREVTFQKDVDDYELLKDILLLLALCVNRRAKKVGLHGKGVTLKLTYADMKSVSRSQAVLSADTAADIYRAAAEMLDRVEHRPVRLVGAGIYNLSGEADRQLSFDDVFGDTVLRKQEEMEGLLRGLQQKYGLDFAGNLEKIYHSDILHKTVEYMRRHS